KIRSEGRIVLTVIAYSGIGSLLLPGGRTAHSKFKIPLIVNDCSMCEIKKGRQLTKLIQDAALIVWDKAHMNHRKSFEALDRTFLDILRGSNPDVETFPFDGKPILLGCEFRQISHVVQADDRADIVDASLT
ncbi:hypothetical protein Ddye_020161, partial [Dipteronia dyeriana]